MPANKKKISTVDNSFTQKTNRQHTKKKTFPPKFGILMIFVILGAMEPNQQSFHTQIRHNRNWFSINFYMGFLSLINKRQIFLQSSLRLWILLPSVLIHDPWNSPTLKIHPIRWQWQCTRWCTSDKKRSQKKGESTVSRKTYNVSELMAAILLRWFNKSNY